MKLKLVTIRLTGLVALVFSMLLFAACSPPPATTAAIQPTTEPEVIVWRVSGSGSVHPILNAIADEFHADYPGYRLDVLPGSDTGDGVRGVIAGALDFAAMSREAKVTETDQGIEFVQFGSTATAVFTHSTVEVTELSGEQLRGLFDGTITNWSEVGGADLTVVVYIRDPNEGNTLALRETFIGDVPFAAGALLLNSQSEMQSVVAGVEGALGYGTWAAVVANQAEVVPLTIDGIGIANPAPKLRSIMGIGYQAANRATLQPLIDWLLSERGQAALANAGVIPLES